MAARLTDPGPTEAFAAKVALQPNGCWQWVGAMQQCKVGNGQPVYGSFTRQGRSHLAHRWAYRAMHGDIPRGLVVDHLCGNSLCVNPFHLDAVTQQTNNQRRVNAQAKRTHCKRGHSFDVANTRITATGERVCRKCKALHEANRRA
jgi:hypothetical protein